MLPHLNLPVYNNFKFRNEGGRTQIFDFIRKKYVALTSEEWVRQNFIQYLVHEKGFPVSLILIESGLKYNRLAKRSDVIIYDSTPKPFILVECKATNVEISQSAFEQAARYNMSLKVKYLIVTNGMKHFCSEMDYTNNTFLFLDNIPKYESVAR